MSENYDLLDRARDLGRVAVLVGGDSLEKEISLMSLEFVVPVMRKLNLSFEIIDVGSDKIFDLKKVDFSRAMILAHGKNGEDGRIQGLLDLMGIPYTGSGALAASQGFNKWLSKLIWQNAGLSVPRGRVISTYDECEDFFHRLSTKLVLKPMRGGSTMGVFIVNNESDLRKAYDNASILDNLLILEEFISGYEVTCGIYNDEALPVIRIEYPGIIYDYHEKYFGTKTNYHCPSGIPESVDDEFKSITITAARALGCRFWGRVDAIVSGDKIYLLELNIAPGLTSHSLYPMALRAANIPFEEFLVKLLENCCVG